MPFKEGDPKPEGSGRQAGTPNKTTSIVKDALEQTFNKLGGQEYMERWARQFPNEFFKILAKLLPKDVQITGEGGEPIQLIIVTGVPKKEEVKPDAPEGH
jgi:hypothetical protein